MDSGYLEPRVLLEARNGQIVPTPCHHPQRAPYQHWKKRRCRWSAEEQREPLMNTFKNPAASTVAGPISASPLWNVAQKAIEIFFFLFPFASTPGLSVHVSKPPIHGVNNIISWVNRRIQPRLSSRFATRSHDIWKLIYMWRATHLNAYLCLIRHLANSASSGEFGLSPRCLHEA